MYHLLCQAKKNRDYNSRFKCLSENDEENGDREQILGHDCPDEREKGKTGGTGGRGVVNGIPRYLTASVC